MCSKPGKARHWALLLGFQQAHQQQGTVAVSCDPWQQVQGPKRCTAGDFHMELSNRNRPEMMGSDGLMGVLLMGVLHMKSRLMTWWCGLWLMICVWGKKCFVWKQKTFGVKPSLGNWDYKGRTSLRTVPGTPTCFHKIWNTNLLTLSKCSVPRNQESVKISSSTSSPANKHNLDTAGFTQGWDPWLHQRWGGAILADKPGMALIDADATCAFAPHRDIPEFIWWFWLKTVSKLNCWLSCFYDVRCRSVWPLKLFFCGVSCFCSLCSVRWESVDVDLYAKVWGHNRSLVRYCEAFSCLPIPCL